MFADDCALSAHSESELQCLATCFSSAAKDFSLTVSIQKSVVMHQPAAATCGTEPSLNIDDATLKNVENFTYLGSCLSSDASLDKVIAIRLFKASNSFGHLWSRVWNERVLKEKTKIAVYRVLSLLYGCESWTCYRRHLEKLDQFHLRCLCKILGITWMDKLSNQDVLRRSNPHWRRSFDHQSAATVVWSRNTYGRQPFTKTSLLFRTGHWQTQTRGVAKTLQGLPEEILTCLQYTHSWMGIPCKRLCCLETGNAKWDYSF